MARQSRIKPVTEKMQIRLRTAAELKAAGSSWATIAQRLGCNADRCRHWPTEYPTEYPTAYPTARTPRLDSPPLPAHNARRQ